MQLTLDPDHLDDGLEDWSLEVGTSGETNADDGSARSDVLSSLLEGLLVNSDEDDSVGTKAIRRGLLYIGNDVLGGGEVDKCLATELLGDHLLLLIASVDTDDTTAHSLSVLASKRSKTTTSTDDGDPLAGLDTGLLQALVDSDTGAENRCNGIQSALLGDAGNVSSLGNAVLLEGAVHCVARQEGLRAKRLIRLLTEVASKARSVDPLDTGVVANLDVINEVALSNNYTGTLVSTDKR